MKIGTMGTLQASNSLNWLEIPDSHITLTGNEFGGSTVLQNFNDEFDKFHLFGLESINEKVIRKLLLTVVTMVWSNTLITVHSCPSFGWLSFL